MAPILKEITGEPKGMKMLMKWHEENLSDMFEGVFAGGAVVLTKKQYIAAVKDLVAACPDFEYSCPTDDWKEEKDQVTATLVVTGTHTAAPYTYLPGKKRKIRARLASKMETPVKCENDPETITWTFSPQMKVRKMTVEPLPGGRGFSGPAGFYVQMGGNLEPPKLCVVL